MIPTTQGSLVGPLGSSSYLLFLFSVFNSWLTLNNQFFSDVSAVIFTNMGHTLGWLWRSLSALLAEATSNQTYLDAAIESATFIQSHLLNPSDIVLNYISSSCVVNQGQFPYNCGIFIEGLVILADMTHNASTESLYVVLAKGRPHTESWFLSDCAVRLLQWLVHWNAKDLMGS